MEMADKKGTSRRGFFGQINHYDENGNKIGESRPSFWGGFDEYVVVDNIFGVTIVAHYSTADNSCPYF